ncbi:hydroxysqualene dehydroxylase [Teichococcus aestuarii]|uniref:hydroxysqualene dehydroxylase n=1 Tax=Teichococcus aestuarii TaxID=568898 RepID=UPI00360F10E9
MSEAPATHVVGAGMAGLAAAWALSHQGRRVVLHEATPAAGGRARALPDGTDNGTHALLGANPAALRFLAEIGARAGWVEPEPDRLPVLDLESGTFLRVALSPLGWWRKEARPPGLDAAGLLALLGAARPGRRVTVSEAFARHPVLLRGFVEPLTLAALNTPPEQAGLRRLGAVLRRMGRPGACRLYVAREGLGPDLVQPALAALAARGVEIRPGDRLRALTVEDGRATALHFAGGTLPVEGGVILATPPWESARLLPGLRVPERHAPILNLHYAHASGGPLRFLGLLGGVGQWVLVRPGAVAVTVSAAAAVLETPLEVLAERVWREVRRAALAARLPGGWPEALPAWRAVKEQRATPLHSVDQPAPPPVLPLPNLALAGDWMEPLLPATIEAATRSGLRAAAALARALPKAAAR